MTMQHWWATLMPIDLDAAGVGAHVLGASALHSASSAPLAGYDWLRWIVIALAIVVGVGVCWLFMRRSMRPITNTQQRRMLKRALDIALSLVVLLPWGLLLTAVVAVLIKLDSPGPVLFRQQRLTRTGKPFAVLKFRTMVPNADQLKAQLIQHNEASGPIFKMRGDPRLTRVGRWLRRTSLDELPQVFNILRGDMSWVGPRPPLPSEVEQYEAWQQRRLNTTTGLTGLWQISGRSLLSFDDMVKLDLYYVENWSLALDLKILLRTIPAVLTGRGAF